MTDPTAPALPPLPAPPPYPPSYHEGSGSVRFWVDIDGTVVGAIIARHVLHYRFRPDGVGEDPLQTYTAHAAEIDAAVRRRVAQGSREPVILREHDLGERPRPA